MFYSISKLIDNQRFCSSQYGTTREVCKVLKVLMFFFILLISFKIKFLQFELTYIVMAYYISYFYFMEVVCVLLLYYLLYFFFCYFFFSFYVACGLLALAYPQMSEKARRRQEGFSRPVSKLILKCFT